MYPLPKCLQISSRQTLLFFTHANSLELIIIIKEVMGDTITLLIYDKVSHKVRLNDIDAPEKSTICKQIKR